MYIIFLFVDDTSFIHMGFRTINCFQSKQTNKNDDKANNTILEMTRDIDSFCVRQKIIGCGGIKFLPVFAIVQKTGVLENSSTTGSVQELSPG